MRWNSVSIDAGLAHSHAHSFLRPSGEGTTETGWHKAKASSGPKDRGSDCHVLCANLVYDLQ